MHGSSAKKKKQGNEYQEFVKAKVRLAERLGFDVDDSEINPILKPHQRACVRWALAGGCRALFESFGLGKSVQQIEICRIITTRLKADDGKNHAGIIVAPLGVRQEFKRDAELLGAKITFIRSTKEAECDYCDGVGTVPTGQFDEMLCPDCNGRCVKHGLFITNYESIREGKISLGLFDAISLDEASVLRSFGSKTFGEFLFGSVQQVKYRFVATATPSPNEYQELLAYSHFLGVMDIGQARTRFFKRNSEKSDDLTLHPHKEKEFWLWVASWALFLQKPSDLGPEYSDEGYDLPELKVIYHEVPVDHLKAAPDKRGQGQMFRDARVGVSEAAREKKDSLEARVKLLLEIAKNVTGNESGVSATVLREEPRRASCEAACAQPETLQGESGEVSAEKQSLEGKESGSLSRACNAVVGKKSRSPKSKVAGVVPEQQTAGGREESGKQAEEVRVDRRSIRANACGSKRTLSDLSGRNEATGSGSLSQHGEGARPSMSNLQRSTRPISRQSGDFAASAHLPEQIVLWCDLDAEQRAIEKALGDAGISYSSVYGSQSVDVKEQKLADWRDGKTLALISKPVILGSGVNLQQAHVAVFVGITYKFNEFLQSIKRLHRYLQNQAVEIHIIYAESEKNVLRSLIEKWERDKEQRAVMSEIIRTYGLSHEALNSEITRSFGVERQEVRGDSFVNVNNDSILETRSMAENSVGMIVTSIPFSTQYEYSPNYNDFGHTDDNDHFFAQMDFLTPELHRILKPGRIAAIHVKDRIVPSGMTGLGFQVVYPFHCDVIRHFGKHGFAFMGMKTIVTDVVRENNQTYRLGWTEQCKDGTKMGVGMPEYLLLFRKPPTENNNSYADEPVVKSIHEYTVARWQVDAEGFERSSGDRLLTPEEISSLHWKTIIRLWKQRSLTKIYDYEEHVALTEALEESGNLPRDFMLMPTHSWHPDIWTDVTRMRTLNSFQTQKGKQVHLCPLQFDIVDRAIVQHSMPGETVLDPFGGIGTVGYRAILKGRKAISIELNEMYWRDASFYMETAEQKMSTPSLFDLTGVGEEVTEELEVI